jgi:catechol 2,3-dioxygenase-like lactoylglutathione lyase family enzyme
MLGNAKLVAFVAARDIARATAFYRDTIGLKLVEETPFATVFDANGTMLRVTPVPNLQVAPYTVLGWDVADIKSTAKKLAIAGVPFSRYQGMQQDEDGIWTSPSGARVAWFQDPDGNTLSLTQF